MLIDWVFDIPNKYECKKKDDETDTLVDVEQTSVEAMEECERKAQSDRSMQLFYYFNVTVHAPSVIHVRCENKKTSDNLPDYVWHVKGDDGQSHEYRGFVPGCVDPTYCDTDPPTTFDTDPPTQLDPDDPQVFYRKPSRGSLKFDDGEVVTYTCTNPSKFVPFLLLYTI